jgi:hypothetical protein
VLIEIDGVRSWYLISFKIGGGGNPHVRRLHNPPTSLDWNVGPSLTWEVSESLVVLRSAWPRRVTDERSLGADEDTDPVLDNLRLGESRGAGVT